MQQQLTDRLILELRSSYNSHARSTWWKLYLYDDATGLSLAVGDPYYTKKQKAENGFAEAREFLKHSLGEA